MRISQGRGQGGDRHSDPQSLKITAKNWVLSRVVTYSIEVLARLHSLKECTCGS